MTHGLNDPSYRAGWLHGQADRVPDHLLKDAAYRLGWINGYASRRGVSLDDASTAMQTWRERHRRHQEG